MPAGDLENRRHRRLLGAIVALGVLLRVVLTWRNPPFNAWDDHFEPIQLLLTQGAIPPKFACFQCYHPPVFYLASAALAWLVSALGLAGAAGVKILQSLNTAFGIATLLIAVALIERLPVSRGARTATALLVAVLPRHLYVSAAHGNDGLAVLLVTLVAWMLIGLGDGRVSWRRYAALGGIASLAIFTKYNGIIVLPAIAAGLALLPAFRDRTWRRSAISRAALAVGVPALLLAAAMTSNLSEYGSALPGNDDYATRNPAAADLMGRQPRDGAGIDFVAFSPWRFVAHPLLRPGQIGEFWTLMHASFWFDNDAKFVQLLASERWAEDYYAWLRGEAPFPDDPREPAAQAALRLGSALELLGTAVLALGAIGAAALALEVLGSRPSRTIGFPAAGALAALATFNVLGMAFWANRVAVYSAVKATYLLPSLGPMAVVVAVGCARVERNRFAWWLVVATVAALAAAVIVHVGQIVLTPQ